MVIRLLLLMACIIGSIHGMSINESGYWMNSAESSALGLAVTAKADSPEAIFFNPAGLMLNSGSSLTFNYSSFYSTNFTTLGMVAKNDAFSFGIGLHYNQTSRIQKTYINDIGEITPDGTFDYGFSSVNISTAAPLFKKWISIGGTIHIDQLRIDSEALKGSSINLGLLIQPLSFIRLGLTHFNVIPHKYKWKSRLNTNSANNYLSPSSTAIGFQVNIINSKKLNWSILADTMLGDKTSEESPTKFGSQFKTKHIVVSLGHNHRFNAIGISTLFKTLEVTTSLMLPANSSMLENRYALGLKYKFSNPND
jgi:hypothetical protein